MLKNKVFWFSPGPQHQSFGNDRGLTGKTKISLAKKNEAKLGKFEIFCLPWPK